MGREKTHSKWCSNFHLQRTAKKIGILVSKVIYFFLFYCILGICSYFNVFVSKWSIFVFVNVSDLVIFIAFELTILFLCLFFRNKCSKLWLHFLDLLHLIQQFNSHQFTSHSRCSCSFCIIYLLLLWLCL